MQETPGRLLIHCEEPDWSSRIALPTVWARDYLALRPCFYSHRRLDTSLTLDAKV